MPSRDVCQQELGTLIDRKMELSILLKAIGELPKMGKVKITEWIRGGQIAWMKAITKHDDSAYGKSPYQKSGGGDSSVSALLQGIYHGLLNQ